MLFLSFYMEWHDKSKKKKVSKAALTSNSVLETSVLGEFLPQLFKYGRAFDRSQNFHLLPSHLKLFQLCKPSEVPEIPAVQLTQNYVV